MSRLRCHDFLSKDTPIRWIGLWDWPGVCLYALTSGSRELMDNNSSIFFCLCVGGSPQGLKRLSSVLYQGSTVSQTLNGLQWHSSVSLTPPQVFIINLIGAARSAFTVDWQKDYRTLRGLLLCTDLRPDGDQNPECVFLLHVWPWSQVGVCP